MAPSPDPPQRPVIIRPAADADRPRQAELYEACFGRGDGARVLPWRYDANPHGRALTLVATEEREGGAGDEGTIAGYACSPRVVLTGGREHPGAPVGQTGDVMTLPDRRGEGVFSRLDREAMEAARRAGWPVVFGLPNRASAPIFTDKLGWRAVGRIRPWTFVLRSDAEARAERLRAGRLAAAGVGWAHLRGVMALGRLRALAREEVNLVPLARFEPDVDPVALRVAAEHPWMVRRDSAYLNWRFLDAPSGRFRAHGAYGTGGDLRGYCIVQVPGAGAAGAAGGGVGALVDLVALDRAARAGAMEAGLSHLARIGASVARAHAIAGSPWERELVRAGFRPPKRGDFKLVIVRLLDPDHPLARAALDPSRWYFTDGDRDDELVS